MSLIPMAPHRRGLRQRGARATEAEAAPGRARRATVRVAGFLLTAALLAAGGLVAGEGDTGESAAERGRLLYRIHCASCHGAAGKGDGPVSPYLKIAPTDLTALAQEGDYPAERVYRTIDGRTEAEAHGRRDMPIWGLSFRVEGLDAEQERDVRARIDALVEYLGSIQEPQEP